MITGWINPYHYDNIASNDGNGNTAQYRDQPFFSKRFIVSTFGYSAECFSSLILMRGHQISDAHDTGELFIFVQNCDSANLSLAHHLGDALDIFISISSVG